MQHSATIVLQKNILIYPCGLCSLCSEPDLSADRQTHKYVLPLLKKIAIQGTFVRYFESKKYVADLGFFY